MPTLDYRIYLAPASGGSFEEYPLETFTLQIDPRNALADSLDFRTRIPFDPDSAPAIEAGRIPGDTALDEGARVELWLGSRRLFKGAVTSSPRRDRWMIDFTAHNDLWRLARSVAEYEGEADIIATFEPAYLRQSANYPEGTLELDPALGSPAQADAYGARGRRSWKLGPMILESNAGGDFEEIPANTFEVAPHKGLVVVSVDFDPGAQYRLKKVQVYEEGTHEVEEILEAVLSYPVANGGPGLDANDFDFEASGVTVSTFIQLKSTGYVSELVEELTGDRYARGYHLFVRYHYIGVDVGDPVKILGRRVYQAVPAPRTIAGVVRLDQPTGFDDVAARVVSTVQINQPGNLAKTATVTNYLTSGDGWEPIYPNSANPAVLIDGDSGEIYGKFKESELDEWNTIASFTLENPTLISRVILTAGTAKGKNRVLAYSVYGSPSASLPDPGSSEWEPLQGMYQVEVNPATLGAGLLQQGASIDARFEDPRKYKHIRLEGRGYKWGSSSKDGSLSCIEVQIFGRQVVEFEAALQNTDAFGGQPLEPASALTGTLTFSSGNQTVTGIGTAFLTEITQREIADGIAIKLAAKDDWLRVLEVVSDTALKIVANCPAGSAGTGAAEKTPFINTYKPELLAAASALGPMTHIDDNETEEDTPGAFLRAYLVLDEKSRFYQGARAEVAPDTIIEPFETVILADTDHNATGIPVLVERIEISEFKMTIEGVNYRA